MDMSIIGKRIKELRLEQNLSQQQLGELILISQANISLWENGRSLPTADFLIILSKQFDVSVDYILGLTEY